MLVVTPWFFGGVSLHVQTALMVVCAGLLLVDAVGRVGNIQSEIVVFLPVTICILFAGIALGLFQLLPLNEDGARRLAAGTVRWHEQIEPDRPEAELGSKNDVFNGATGPKRLARSLYSPSTRENVALLLLVTGVFWLSSRCFAEDKFIVWLMIALTLCGAAMAMFGLLQRFTWNGKMYWQIPLTMGGSPFGSFVNRNNGGGFLNMCLAGCVGLYVWLLGRSGSDGSGQRIRRSFDDDIAAYSDPAELGATHLWVMGALVLIGCAIVASASRGSILSLLVAAAAVFALMLARRGRRSQSIGIFAAGLLAFAMVVWLGEFAEVQDRFNELSNNELGTRTRAKNWGEAMKSLPDFWVLGSGLGTYRFVCLPFQDRFNTAVHYYAENQYVQSLTDAGVVGLSLMLLAIGVTCWSIVRLLQTENRVSVALAMMGLFALGSQMVGGAFDFGLYLPANAIIMASICGAVCGRAANQCGVAKPSWSPGIATHPVLALGVAASLLVGVGFGAVELHKSAEVQDVVMVGLRGEVEEQRDDGALVELINSGNRAVAKRADDADGHRVLADLWMQRYRVALFGAMRQNEPWIDEKDAWLATSLVATSASLHDTTPEEQAKLVEGIRSEPATDQLLKPAWRQAKAAQLACPWQPQTYLALAILSPFVDTGDNAAYLENARHFAGGDPSLWFRIGLLEEIAGRRTLAIDSWKRTLELSSRYESAVLSELASDLTVETVDQVVPRDLSTRLRVTRQLNVSYPDIAKALARQSVESIGDQEETPENIAANAAFLALLGQNAESIQGWRKAIEMAGIYNSDPSWHVGLIEVLLASDDLEGAESAAADAIKRFPNDRRLEDSLDKARKASN